MIILRYSPKVNIELVFQHSLPLLLDIDSESQKLQDAYELTCHCLEILYHHEKCKGENCIRVIFSGMKGFHIEAKPIEPLDNLLIRDALFNGLDEIGIPKQETKNQRLNCVIDPIRVFGFVRLTGSYNSWKEGSVVKRRKVIQFTPEEFSQLHVADIISRSETT